MKKLLLLVTVLLILLNGCITLNQEATWKVSRNVYAGGGAVLRW